MSASPPPPDRTADVQLLQRLLGHDPTLPSDVCVAYWGELNAWLMAHNRSVDPAWCEEAAGDALLALIHQPAAYQPGLQSLPTYLHLAAQRDLQNILRRNKWHHRHRVAWNSGELSADGGKYGEGTDNLSFRLRLAEEEEGPWATVPHAVRANLTRVEEQVLRLLLRQERKHAAYAAACEVTHLPLAVQRQVVRQTKGRIQARLRRAPEHGEGSP